MSDYNILRYNGKSEQFSITDPAPKQQIIQGQAAHPKQAHKEQEPPALVDLLQPQHLPVEHQPIPQHDCPEPHLGQELQIQVRDQPDQGGEQLPQGQDLERREGE